MLLLFILVAGLALFTENVEGRNIYHNKYAKEMQSRVRRGLAPGEPKPTFGATIVPLPDHMKLTGRLNRAGVRAPINAQQKFEERAVPVPDGIRQAAKLKTLVNAKQHDGMVPQPPTIVSAPGSKRVVAAIAANPDVQAAVVEKGIEVAGKLVDKQLQIIDEAQDKAEEFLKKKLEIDITPDKSFGTSDTYLPAGYHIHSKMDNQPSEKSSEPEPYYTYTAGAGSVIMNGCWGTGYKAGDPCFQAIKNGSQCRNMIDGAAFIGVGFDLRGEYNEDSRKTSIIQRDCGGKSSYDGFQVPDTMNVHGIYDTSASSLIFSSQTEYQSYLQTEAGVSGSYFGFYAGVKAAWGTSTSMSQQSYLSIFDIDVDRYEIFQDEVKPEALSRSFLREFMDLPTSYYSPGAPSKYQDFILRWGTHYIKSGRFGGKLEFRKTMDSSKVSSKEAFATEMVAEYKGLFASAGVRASSEGGSSYQSSREFSSSQIVAQGGDQAIAAIITDVYSPSFKAEFKAWLGSIPDYPKAFKFLMGSITDLLNFRANDLFPEEPLDWGCEANKAEVAENNGYYLVEVDGTEVKQYCTYTERGQLENAIRRRRESLRRAIIVYMEEGPISISDIEVPANEGECQYVVDEKDIGTTRPTWADMTEKKSPFKVVFDLDNDLIKSNTTGKGTIKKSSTRIVQFNEDQWFTSDEDGIIHLYGGYSNDGTGTPSSSKKMSIRGLILTYNVTNGKLVLKGDEDYEKSKVYFPWLDVDLEGHQVAKVLWRSEDDAAKASGVGFTPCSVKWSNALRFDPTDREGKCVHFTATSSDTMFVVLAVIPSDHSTWYYVEISRFRVRIYKAQKHLVSTTDSSALAIADSVLFQSYFVCVTERAGDAQSQGSTLIEYGKTLGEADTGDIYLTAIDAESPLNVRFYAFGNKQAAVQVMDAHIVTRGATKADCKGETFPRVLDDQTIVCTQNCHEACDPLRGCKTSEAGKPKATECGACQHAKDEESQTCLLTCPPEKVPNSKKICVDSYEVEFKESNSEISAPANAIEMPRLHDFTICLWMKLTKGEADFDPIYVVDYDPTAEVDSMVFGAFVNPGRQIKLSFSLKLGNLGSADAPNTFTFVNDVWFHACVTRETDSGMVKLFHDGQNVFGVGNGHVLNPGVAVVGNGKLSFVTSSSDGVTLSDVNFWNGVKSLGEIQNIAKVCGEYAGDIIDWLALKEHLTPEHQALIKTPSSCSLRKTPEEEAPEEEAPEEEAPEEAAPEEDDKPKGGQQRRGGGKPERVGQPLIGRLAGPAAGGEPGKSGGGGRGGGGGVHSKAPSAKKRGHAAPKHR